MGRDQVRVHAELQHAKTVPEIVLPDRRVPLLEILSTPQVVDQHVQAALLSADPRDQRFDLARHKVVNPDRDAPAAGRGDLLGGFFDGLRPAILGLLRPRRSAGHIDGRAGLTKLHGNAPACAACAAGYQRYLALKRHPELSSISRLPPGMHQAPR